MGSADRFIKMCVMDRLPPAFILSLACTLVQAGQEEVPSFEAIDSNGDGVISVEEAAAVNGFDFEDADADGDGVVSREEYEAYTE